MHLQLIELLLTFRFYKLKEIKWIELKRKLNGNKTLFGGIQWMHPWHLKKNVYIKTRHWNLGISNCKPNIPKICVLNAVHGVSYNSMLDAWEGVILREGYCSKNNWCNSQALFFVFLFFYSVSSFDNLNLKIIYE